MPDSEAVAMADRRALLTEREREIVSGEADVSDSYRYQTVSRVRSRLQRLEDDLDALGIEAVGMSQDRQDRRTRRSLREQLDQTLEAEGYDPDEWNTDARADGTLILQDPETNKTKTIEPDSGESGIDSAVESLDSDSDSSADTGTYDPDTSGEGGRANTDVPGVDGLDSGRIAAALAVAGAVLYGVMQS